MIIIETKNAACMSQMRLIGRTEFEQAAKQEVTQEMTTRPSLSEELRYQGVSRRSSILSSAAT